MGNLDKRGQAFLSTYVKKTENYIKKISKL